MIPALSSSHDITRTILKFLQILFAIELPFSLTKIPIRIQLCLIPPSSRQMLAIQAGRLSKGEENYDPKMALKAFAVEDGVLIFKWSEVQNSAAGILPCLLINRCLITEAVKTRTLTGFAL